MLESQRRSAGSLMCYLKKWWRARGKTGRGCRNDAIQQTATVPTSAATDRPANISTTITASSANTTGLLSSNISAAACVSLCSSKPAKNSSSHKQSSTKSQCKSHLKQSNKTQIHEDSANNNNHKNSPRKQSSTKRKVGWLIFLVFGWITDLSDQTSDILRCSIVQVVSYIPGVL